MHAVHIQAATGLSLEQRCGIARRQIDQQRRAFLAKIRAQLPDSMAGNQHHLAGVTQGVQRLRRQLAQRDVGELALPRRHGIQDGLARLQADVAGRDHLAHAQIRLRLVAGPRLCRALGIGQRKIEVLSALLRHSRDPPCFDIERMPGLQAQLQGLAAVVLINAIAVARAARDVLLGHQAYLALADQRPTARSDNRTRLGVDRNALRAPHLTQAEIALRGIQAHRRIAIGGHHAAYGLHG